MSKFMNWVLCGFQNFRDFPSVCCDLYITAYITIMITYPWVGCGVPGALFLCTGWFAFALQTLESEADLERLSSPPEWLPLRELNGLVAEPLVVGFRCAWLGLKPHQVIYLFLNFITKWHNNTNYIENYIFQLIILNTVKLHDKSSYYYISTLYKYKYFILSRFTFHSYAINISRIFRAVIYMNSEYQRSSLYNSSRASFT